MMDFKKEIKYLFVFIALTCIYFSEVFLKGAVLAIGDGFDEFYPLMLVVSEQYKDFIFPFWNPYMYSGFPLFGSMQAGVLYPLNIVLPLLFGPTWAFNLNLMLHYALAGFFTFLYCRQIGLKVFPSLVAGIVFSLLGYLPSHLIHPSIITSGAWIPLLLLFYERLRNDLTIKDSLYAAIVFALQVFAGHPQICFYTYILLATYVTFHLFYLEPSKRMRFCLLSVLSFGAGMLIALPQLVATQELSNMALRAKLSYETFSSYAFPVHLITSFLFPFFYYLGGQDGEYWGPVPDLGVEAFVGTLPFLLAIAVMLKWKKDPHILFWGIIAVLAFVLALGDAVRPINRLLFHLPGYNSFRGPSKHILEMSLALSILAGFGISLLQETEKRFHTAVIIALSATIVASLITFTVFDDVMRNFLKNIFSHMQHFQLRWERGDIPEEALSMADPAIYVPIITMSVYLACILVFLKASPSPLSPPLKGGEQKESPPLKGGEQKESPPLKGGEQKESPPLKGGEQKKPPLPWRERARVRGSFQKYLKNAAMFMIFLVIFAEALLYKLGPIPEAHYVENYFKDLSVIPLSDPGGRTVFFSGNMLPMKAMSYGVRLLEGYDPLRIGDYMKLAPAMFEQPPAVRRAFITNNSLLSMMSAKYLFVDNEVGDLEDITWFLIEDETGGNIPSSIMQNADAGEPSSIYRKLASYPDFSIYENVIALPRARSIDRLTPINTAAELRQRLFSFQMNPWHEAAVSMEDLREIGTESFTSGDVSIVEDKPNRVATSAIFPGKGFLVLADQFYPGWEAYIDGKKAKIYRTNGVQRGVVVPDGEHTIVFQYVPRRIYAAMVFSGVILAGMLFVLLRKGFGSHKKQT